MQIKFFSTAYTGGAGIAAKRLYNGLQSYQADFEFYSLQNFTPSKSQGLKLWLQKIKTSLYYRNLEKQLIGRPTNLEIFSPATLPYQTPFLPIIDKKTVLHLHWINDLIDFPSFYQSIPSHIPIIWTLHDCNTFTGGCHYTNDCQNFKTTCKNCPQLGIQGSINFANQQQQIKYNSLKNKNLHIVTPSQWLQKEAENSSILQHAKSFQTISNGLDLQEFSPQPKDTCKKLLNIPLTSFVIAFGAEKLNTTRKGLHLLWQALTLLPNLTDITLLIFGKNFEIPTHLQGKINVCYVGEVNKGLMQRIIYSAADIFVVPSLEDNQPLTCMESMSCGTPVIAFNIGGLAEMIQNNQTGTLSPKGDYTDFAAKIHYLYEHQPIREKMGNQARNFAEHNFAIAKQAEKYWKLYEKVNL